MKLIDRASRFLWTHVSGTLEHFVLWWNAAPLACRPVGCTKYLREWLLTQSEDAPEPILSTLKSLGEILTIHVIGCLWDKQFRNCLVLSNGKPDQKFDRTSEFYSPPSERVSSHSFNLDKFRCLNNKFLSSLAFSWLSYVRCFRCREQLVDTFGRNFCSLS